LRPDAGERRPALVLVDGPSGSGKSTLADALVRDGDPAALLPPGAQLLRLDDVYPGWDGL
jgi:uridine kinase